MNAIKISFTGISLIHGMPSTLLLMLISGEQCGLGKSLYTNVCIQWNIYLVFTLHPLNNKYAVSYMAPNAMVMQIVCTILRYPCAMPSLQNHKFVKNVNFSLKITYAWLYICAYNKHIWLLLAIKLVLVLVINSSIKWLPAVFSLWYPTQLYFKKCISARNSGLFCLIRQRDDTVDRHCLEVTSGHRSFSWDIEI